MWPLRSAACLCSWKSGLRVHIKATALAKCHLVEFAGLSSSVCRGRDTASAVPAVTSAVFLIHHCSQPGTPCLTPVHPGAERAGCGGPYVSSCLWAGPPEISCPVKCSVCVVFYSSVLFSVLSPSVLNHLSASLMQLCRRNLCGCLTQPRHHSAPGLAGEH